MWLTNVCVRPMCSVWPAQHACPQRHCRLNWQLHFGEPPKWAHGVRFILVDPEPSERDAGIAAQTLRGATCPQ